MVHVAGSTSSDEGAQVKVEVMEDRSLLGPEETNRGNTRSTDDQASGAPESKDIEYEDKSPVTAPKGAARDSA
ncbi:hypothetical protein ON010_g18572 [Phytophthora cinnamomi]|nr:hypothetical protein ON010_g18572 [Phytophthora cinnamomi]